MITEDYVSFEIAKLLKKKGFDAYVSSFYDNEGKFSRKEADCNWNIGMHYSAPTLQMAVKWLREKYNYHIIATPKYSDVEYMPGQWQEEFLGWKYVIIPLNENKSIMHPSVYSSTVESAYEAAIKYCLENLI